MTPDCQRLSIRFKTTCQLKAFTDFHQLLLLTVEGNGRKIKGKVAYTIVKGKVILKEEEVIGQPAYGKFILPDQD